MDTSLSLIESLKGRQGWERFVVIYARLLEVWMQKYDVQPADVDDLVQEVLLTVANEIGSFEHNGRQGAFRTWLKSILVNRLRRYWRSRSRNPKPLAGSAIGRRLAELADATSEISRIWEEEHDRHIIHQLLNLIEPHFTRPTWLAFVQQAIEGKRADVVAKNLDMSVNSVFIAKSRVLRRLRREAAVLVDEDSDFF